MKKNNLLVAGMIGVLLLSGCASTAAGDDSSVSVSEEISTQNPEETNIENTETDIEEESTEEASVSGTDAATDAASETVGDVVSGEIETMRHTKFVVPEGFTEVSQENGEYERNAAGGLTYAYKNEQLQMSIEFTEAGWWGDAKEEFLQQDYDYYTKAYADIITDKNISGNEFYIVQVNEDGSECYRKGMVNDTLFWDIAINYPAGDEACISVRDEFLNSFDTTESN